MKKGCVIVAGCVGLIWLGVAQAAVDWNARLNTELTQISAVPVIAAMRTGTQKIPRRELTLLLAQARMHWDELAPDTQQLALPWMARPTDASKTFEASWRYGSTPEATPRETTNFRIHYIDIGVYPANTNAATSTFVDNVALELENVYAVEHTTLGFAAVPADTSSSTNGGNAKFDVYLANTGSQGIYGYVYSEGYTAQADDFGAWSYMVLDNNFAEFVGDALDSLRVTVAHEYFHAIQFGYSAKEEGSFMEHASTWVEDIVYPGINDNYQYLGEPYADANSNGQYDVGESFTDRGRLNGVRDEGMLDYPEYPLDAYDVDPIILYGHFVWARYLYEKFDSNTTSSNGIIKRIFVEAGQVSSGNTYTAIDSVLQSAYGSSLAQAYQEYATWLYDKSKFSDGANYPLVWVDRVVSGTDTAFSSVDSPGLMAFNTYSGSTQFYLSSVFTEISAPVGSYQFVSFGGSPALTMLVDNGGGALTPQMVTLTSGVGTWTVSGTPVRAIAVVSNVSSSFDGMDWTIRTTGKTSTVAPSLVSVTLDSGLVKSWSAGDATIGTTTTEGVLFTVLATDGDGTTPRFKVISDGTGGHFDPVTNTFNWTTGVTAGTYQVQLAAYDAVDARVSTYGTITIVVEGNSSVVQRRGVGAFDSSFTVLMGLMMLLFRLCNTRGTTPQTARCRIQSALPVYNRRR